MAYGYSLDLRQRALGAVSRGEGTYQDIAARYEIGTATLTRWCRRQRERGSVAALPHGGGQAPAFSPAELLQFEQMVLAHPDATAVELARRWYSTMGKRVSSSAVRRAWYKLGITRKKSHSASSRHKPSG